MYCGMFNFLQYTLKASDVKFVPANNFEIFIASLTWQMSSWLCELDHLLTGLQSLLQLGTYYSNLQNTQKLYMIIINTSAPTTSQSLYDKQQCSAIPHNCVCWYSRHVKYCVTVCPMLAFMLTQYTDCLTSSHVFSMPMWLLCSHSKICFCSRQGIIMHLLFIKLMPYWSIFFYPWFHCLPHMWPSTKYTFLASKTQHLLLLLHLYFL